VLRRPRRHGHALGYCYYDDGLRRRSVNTEGAACRSTSTSYRRCCGKPDLREMTCQPQHKHPVGGQRSLPAHVTWETVIATSGPMGHLESRGKLRPALKRVSTLAGFDLGESIYDVAALGFGKPRNGITLGLEAKPRGALLLGADPDIGDDLLHSSATHDVHERRRGPGVQSSRRWSACDEA
jgi:hypothetical protein